MSLLRRILLGVTVTAFLLAAWPFAAVWVGYSLARMPLNDLME